MTNASYNFFKQSSKIRLRKSYKLFVYLLVAVLTLAIIAAIVYFVAFKNAEEQLPRGAVVTNGHECAQIGTSILDKGGSAVDAAIAALFCEGIAMPQSMGLGGGFLMTIYIKETGKVIALNARETAPGLANSTMFENDSDASTTGGLAVAVPGELRGYWKAYQKYGGKVAWKDLVQPTIDLCRKGILVTKYLEGLFEGQFGNLYKDAGLRRDFINPATNRTYRLNERVKRLKLAETLEVIAREGGDAINDGSLTQGLVDDIQRAGGIITAKDLTDYQPQWQQPIKIRLPFDQTLYTSPPPGSGVILGFILNILDGFLDYSRPSETTNWQRIIESFKYGYGKRTELGDTSFVDIEALLSNLTSEDYARMIRSQIQDNVTYNNAGHYGANTTLKEDHGTAHISVLAPNGDAVSVTSTINLYFGAKFMSPSTGIILNDEMDDFSSPSFDSNFGIPPSVANFIEPGKRPLSSMCPSIIVGDDGKVKLVIGAAGGTKITTSVALVAIRNLWFNQTIDGAIADKRLHHQLFPMLVELEQTWQNDNEFIDALKRIGHNVTLSPETGFSALTAISTHGGRIRTGTDKRRPGASSMIY